tara:strand:+ start:5060 stop:6013 length:954 start_codon:yes stop_codon:yes gene_type:complete
VIIDAFAHLYPRAYVDFLERMDLPMPIYFRDHPTFTDPAARVAELDQLGIDMQALAVGTPAFDELFSPEQEVQALEAARIGNDGIAASTARYPGKFIGIATLPLLGLQSIESALLELDRAVNQLNMAGIQLYTDVNSLPLDHPALFPIYEKLIEHDLPILLHPKSGDYNTRTNDYLLWLTFGWPFETTLAMSRLVYSGVLDKYPRLKILTHHLGALVPHMAARIEGVTYTLQRVTDWSLPKPVLSYFKQFYGDTAVNGYKPALESGYEFFGAEHIMFATDAPFVPVGPQLAAIQDWDVQVKQKEQILGTNARRFYNV